MGISVVQKFSSTVVREGGMKKPKRIDLDLDRVDALLKRVETGTLQDGDYQIIKAIQDSKNRG